MKQSWEIKELGDVANVSSGAPQNKELFENGHSNTN